MKNKFLFLKCLSVRKGDIKGKSHLKNICSILSIRNILNSQLIFSIKLVAII